MVLETLAAVSFTGAGLVSAIAVIQILFLYAFHDLSWFGRSLTSLLPTGKCIDHPSQVRDSQFYSAFRAEFLAAIAPDAGPIVINRWTLFIAVKPIDGLGVGWAHIHTNSAAHAFFFSNKRLGDQAIVDKPVPSLGLKWFYR